jgi:hypothetical protein
MLDMKGPNPFAFLDENPEAVSGRKYEAGIFNDFASAASAGQARVLVVEGGPGSGKTHLMRYFMREAEKKGMLAPYVRVEKGEGVAGVIGRICQETALLHGFRRSVANPETFGALARALEHWAAGRHSGAGRHFGIVVFIDDADNMRKAGDAVTSITGLVAAMHGRTAVSFVLGSTRELRAGGAPETVTTMGLKHFDEHEAKEAIDKGLGKEPKMGEECLHNIMDDTNGNPRLIKTVCRHLYDRLRDNEKVINKGHYLAYLPYIMSMLSGEWFGRMYQKAPASEREILAAMAESREGMHVSDIARQLGKPLGPTTALMKRLLDSGQITRIGRGKYRIFAGLYARYVAQRALGNQEPGRGGQGRKPARKQPFRKPAPSPSRKPR